MISVIIPCYNLSSYLPRCLDSILESKNKDLEIIVVNDGSTDDSAAIADNFAQKDQRIKVIHKPNGGVSTARNAGLEVANGEWISFVDGDDYVSPDFFVLDNSDLDKDIIIKPYCFVKNGTAYDVRRPSFSFRNREVFYHYYANRRLNALWNKIFSRRIVAGKKFYEGFPMGEDFFFMLSVIPEILSYTCSSTGCYFYDMKESSVCGSFFNDEERVIGNMVRNLNKLHELTTKGEELYYLKRSIMYNNYVLGMYKMRKKLNDQQHDLLRNVLTEMTWSDLRYVPLLLRLKIFSWHFTFTS